LFSHIRFIKLKQKPIKNFSKVTRRDKPFGIPRHRYEDNIRTNILTECERLDWIYMAQYRNQWQDLVNSNESLS
jgi:hypothetical protein